MLNHALKNQALSQPVFNSLRVRDRPDNSFTAAKNLATLAPGYGFKPVRASGTVGRDDLADFYRISLLPGASFSGIALGLKVKRAPV